MQRFSNLATGLRFWALTRGMQRRHASRDAFLAWQDQELKRWLRKDLPRVPFYAATSVRAGLDDLPRIDKSHLMAEFHRFNRAGITADEGWELFDGDRRKGIYHVGASTGTSGNRGLFVISDRERFAWLGAILGKLLPDIWKCRERVAILLPLHTRLYDAANESGQVRLKFFDISQGLDCLLPEVTFFAPSIIVAPPRVLRWLSEHGTSALDPARLYAGAEVLDPVDAALIEARWPGRLDQIFMATEGLLGTSCSHGTLHLAEDIMHFELEPIPGSPLVSPIITDFRRRAQIICRYRMNDLLRPAATPCPCGSPLLAIDEIVGRRDDCFEFATPEGLQLVTPDILRNVVLDSDRRIQDFRIERIKPDELRLSLPAGIEPQSIEAASSSLLRALHIRGVSVTLTAEAKPLPVEEGRKLRRVADLTKVPGSPPVSF